MNKTALGVSKPSARGSDSDQLKAVIWRRFPTRFSLGFRYETFSSESLRATAFLFFRNIFIVLFYHTFSSSQ